MSEFHVQVVRLGDIKPLENSDFLGITEVYGAGGYPCIVKRGDFKPGDLAIYIPVDSVVPDTEQFNFLAPSQKVPGSNGANSRLPVGSVPERYRRICAKRLRGTFSMGLLVPAAEGMAEGDDVAAALGIVKYESAAGALGHMGYTDIEGLRRWAGIFQEGEEVVVLEKMHGECMRGVCEDDQVLIGSRTTTKGEGESHFWKAAEAIGLPAALRANPSIAVYGEAIGRVKGFSYGLKSNGDITARVFDARDARTLRWFDWDEVAAFCAANHLPAAPVLYRGPWSNDLRALANGQSTIDPSHIREGIVVRPVRERFDSKLGRVILKLHGEEFLLKTGKGACV